MLPDSQMAALRADLGAFLTETAQVQRATAVADGYGGQTQSWNTVATLAALRATAGLRPDERVVAERMTGHQVWGVLLPAGSDVRASDRLVMGTRTFEVVAVLSGSIEAARRAMVIEVG